MLGCLVLTLTEITNPYSAIVNEFYERIYVCLTLIASNDRCIIAEIDKWCVLVVSIWLYR